MSTASATIQSRLFEPGLSKHAPFAFDLEEISVIYKQSSLPGDMSREDALDPPRCVLRPPIQLFQGRAVKAGCKSMDQTTRFDCHAGASTAICGNFSWTHVLSYIECRLIVAMGASGQAKYTGVLCLFSIIMSIRGFCNMSIGCSGLSRSRGSCTSRKIPPTCVEGDKACPNDDAAFRPHSAKLDGDPLRQLGRHQHSFQGKAGVQLEPWKSIGTSAGQKSSSP